MKKAFTLIEMLVVIAIIAILAGLLMPALARARQEARKTHCLSNQKQVGLQLAMYQSDNRGRFPSVWFTAYDGRGRQYDSSLTIAQLWPDYADNSELFHCFATDNEVFLTIDGTDGNVLNLDNNPDTNEYRFETEINEWNDPDYLIDPNVPRNARSGRAIYADGPDLAYLRSISAGSFPARNYANHIYGSNVLYYGGHAEFVRMDDDGVTPNLALLGEVGGFQVRMDSDIFADDNWNGGANWDDDESVDCNLGNLIDCADDTRDINWYELNEPLCDYDPVN